MIGEWLHQLYSLDPNLADQPGTRPMTKSELVERLLKKGARDRGEAVRVVETIFECLGIALRQGERIEIRGLGSFCVRSYKGYQGRNPKTGETIVVKSKRLPYFKPSKMFSAKINDSAMAAPETVRTGRVQLSPQEGREHQSLDDRA